MKENRECTWHSTSISRTQGDETWPSYWVLHGVLFSMILARKSSKTRAICSELSTMNWVAGARYIKQVWTESASWSSYRACLCSSPASAWENPYVSWLYTSSVRADTRGCLSKEGKTRNIEGQGIGESSSHETTDGSYEQVYWSTVRQFKPSAGFDHCSGVVHQALLL